MNNQQFIKYIATRYGIAEPVVETMIDMFGCCLQELLDAGCSVAIDEIGEFKPTPLFPQGLNHRNNHALAKAARRNMVSFTASDKLTRDVA